MATKVEITTSKKNIVAQKVRASLSLALACSKDGDRSGLRAALKQFDDAAKELKTVII